MSEREREQETPARVRVMEFVGLKDELGLDGHFNTFRIGDKWADLKFLENLELSVVDEGAERTDQLHALVMGVYAGQLDDMLELHADMNHGRSRLIIERRHLLETAYDTKLDGSEKCVVVYLHVCPEDGGRQ